MDEFAIGSSTELRLRVHHARGLDRCRRFRWRQRGGAGRAFRAMSDPTPGVDPPAGCADLTVSVKPTYDTVSRCARLMATASSLDQGGDDAPSWTPRWHRVIAGHDRDSTSVDASVVGAARTGAVEGICVACGSAWISVARQRGYQPGVLAPSGCRG